jgi:hypothetical protein
MPLNNYASLTSLSHTLLDAELLGRVLNVTVAKPMTNKLGSKRAIWEEEGDSYFLNSLREDGTETIMDADINEDPQEVEYAKERVAKMKQ